MEQKRLDDSMKSEDFNREEKKNDNAHECQFCQKVFAHNSSLIKHIRIHTGDKPYLCSFPNCNHKFSQVSNLIRHKRIHNGIKPFSCNYCQKTFTSSSNLKQHASIHQNQFNRSKFVCIINECKKSYLYICTLKKHLQAAHKKENDMIMSEFSEEKNFISIYKKLIKEPQRFPFIILKNHSTYFSSNQDLCPSDTSSSGGKGERYNQSFNFFNFNNPSLPGDSGLECRNPSQYNDDLKNVFVENIFQIKTYLEILTKSVIKQSLERNEINNFTALLQTLNQPVNNSANAGIMGLENPGHGGVIYNNQINNLKNLMILNYMKSK